MQAWQQKLSATKAEWKVLAPQDLKAMHGTRLAVQKDQSVLASGPNGGTNTYSMTIAAGLPSITGFRVEVLPHKSLPRRGPGRAGNGNFVLSELKVFAVDAEGMKQQLKFSRAVADIEQADGNNNPYKAGKPQPRSTATPRAAAGAGRSCQKLAKLTSWWPNWRSRSIRISRSDSKL